MSKRSDGLKLRQQLMRARDALAQAQKELAKLPELTSPPTVLTDAIRSVRDCVAGLEILTNRLQSDPLGLANSWGISDDGMISLEELYKRYGIKEGDVFPSRPKGAE